MPSARVRRLLSWTLAILLVGAIGVYVRHQGDVLRRLLDVSPASLAWLVFAWLMLSIPRGLLRRTMAEPLGVRLVFVDWYGLSMVTNLISLVTPARSDFVITAGYLKHKYGLPISHFISLVYGTAVVTALILSAEGAIALLAIVYTRDLSHPVVWVAVALLGLAAIPLAFGGRANVPWSGWVWDKVRAALGGWETIRRDRRSLAKSAMLTVASTLCFTLWTYAAFRALHIEVGVAPVFFASVTGQMASYTNLTPGNLGVREAILGFVTEALGIGFAEGVAVTLLQRAVSTVLFVLVGGVFGLRIFRETLQAAKETET